MIGKGRLYPFFLVFIVVAADLPCAEYRALQPINAAVLKGVDLLLALAPLGNHLTVGQAVELG